MLVRDPETGLVSDVGVHHDDKPNVGAIERSFLKHSEDELMEQGGVDVSLMPGITEGQSLDFQIGLDEQLVVEEATRSVDIEHNGCQNAIDWPGMWVNVIPDRVAIVHPKSPFLDRLAYVCVKAGIRHCRNKECLSNREMVDKRMPQCEWSRFREWASLLVSCQASFSSEQKLSRAHTHLAAAANILHWLLMEYKNGDKKLTGTLVRKDDKQSGVDLFGVCEVVYWLITIQSSLSLGTVVEGSWGPEFLPPNITAPAVTKAIRQARELGLCQNRFWNLGLVMERKHVDLPALMETAVNHPQLQHKEHNKCIPSFCRFTALDSTRVRQLHKCDDEAKCVQQLQFNFDPELLNKLGGRTVWSISEPFEVLSHDRPYVAVSHVWSDGTGIGLQPLGLVNRCLFNYLADITRRLGCEAIWWDTISIPTDKVARRKAINEMHNNYSRAACTVLHDQYLLNYEWADDGSPCLALVFSSWITRGWTALELIMSNKLKVLFKGHDGRPVIKDLDDDILANDPSRCSRAHWIASTILRRLRKPINNVTDLMTVLKPRSTSWARDRMIIAGLLAGLDDFDYSRDQDEITKAVVDKLVKINPSSLLHGQATLAKSDGWSWCPPSLYDMPADSIGDLFHSAGSLGELSEPSGAIVNTCLVDKDGVIAGYWYYRVLEEEDSTRDCLVPNSSHMSVTLKVKDALRRWRYCLLLRDNWEDRGPALLVCPVGKDSDSIHCRYVGSVYEMTRPQSGDFDERYGYEGFRIGNEGDRPDILATEFLDNDQKEFRSKATIN